MQEIFLFLPISTYDDLDISGLCEEGKLVLWLVRGASVM